MVLSGLGLEAKHRRLGAHPLGLGVAMAKVAGDPMVRGEGL